MTLDGVPNPAAGLGNLAYDAAHRQLFVSDLHSGMIHRLDLEGRDLGRFDHGVTARAAAKLAPVAYDPKTRPNIATARFDSTKPATWGYAPAPRQVWALTVHEGRLYYSVAAGPQVWSVGIARDGGYADDPRWEFDVPAQAGPLPVTDIAFSEQGAMLLAQRALVAGFYDYSAFTQPGEPQVFRIWPKRPNDPPSPGRWKLEPEEYAVGFAGNYRNTNGGIALGYGYGRDGTLATNACEFALWTTGQNLRNAPSMRKDLEPGGPLVLNGLQASPASPVRNFNAPPWTSYFVRYGDKADDPGALGHLDSVRIYAKPCVAPAVYGGPGHQMDAPYTAPPTVIVGPGCAGTDCPHGIDVKLDKKITSRDGPHVTFEIDVTNVGEAITSGNFTVTDNVPAGMTVMSVAGPWTCGTVPITGPGQLTCTYTAGSVPANTTLPGIVLTTLAPTQGWQNCATVSLPGDGNPSNDKGCANDTPTGELIVLKKVDYNGPLIMPSLTYPVTVTCGGWSHAFNLVPGVQQSVGDAPLNTACNVSETLPPAPAAACPAPLVTTWAPMQVAPSNPFQITGATLSVTVTNTLDCKPGDQTGSLMVKKVVVTDKPIILSTANFPVTVTCGSMVTNLSVSSDGTPQTVNGIPMPSSCTVTEDTSSLPNVCPNSLTPTWSQPNIAPSPVPISPGPIATVTITNTVNCGNGGSDTGYLRVTKTIDRGDVNLPLSQLTSMAFPMTATCGSSTYPLTVSMTSPGIVTGIPANATCTVSETLPPPPVNGCSPRQTPVWVNSPSYSPANVTIVPGQGPVINVKNTLQCQPIGTGGSDGSIDVTKTVNNLTNGLVSTAGLTYPVTVTCGSNATTLTLSENVPQTVQSINTSTSCTVAEGTIVTPSGCPTDYLPSWSTTITPSGPIQVNGPHTQVTVANTITCKLIPSGKGWLSVNKVIVNPDNVPVGGLTFPATASCGGTDTPLSLSTSGPQIVNNLTPGTTCTVTETLPPPPTTGCIGGPSPHWVNSPSYAPASTTVTGGSPATITVTNTITCAAQTPPRPPKCAAPMVPDPKSGECECPNGMHKRGKRCVEQIACRPPAHPNARGTACVCPENMIMRGKACVRREERRRHSSEQNEDIRRVLPGMIDGPGIFRGGNGGGKGVR